MAPLRSHDPRWTWTAAGAAFGLCFPLIAAALHGWQYNFSDPLMVIIATAPFFLGCFAFLGGNQNYRALLMHQNLEELVEQRTRELDRQRANSLESAKMAALGQMAAGIAHEIRTPLSIINSRADSLRRHIDQNPPDRESCIAAVAQIKAMVQRMDSIIRTLLSLARDGLHDQLEPTSVRALLFDVQELCRDRFNHSGVELRIAEVPELMVTCCPSQIAQVLVNLLNNAHDAISELPEKWVELEVVQLPNAILLQVTDSGNGIAPDVAAKLMQPFFSTKGHGKGTGLGLNLSATIAENHGGNLFYDPSHPHTRFVLRLPWEQAC